MAINAGASALGLVSSMPSGPGVISEDLIAEVSAAIPVGITSVLLTSQQNPASIIEQHQKCRTNAIQLCDRLSVITPRELQDAMPGTDIMQVIHVTGQNSIEEAVSIAPFVNAILLDSGNKSLPIKVLGGTGKIHDWKISREIRDRVEVSVYLAGGLTPENVAEAIREVSPFGVDVCNGVRTNGLLDKRKLQKFLEQVNSAT
ncbi:N-(5'-phosphoribosyl)anthranilate isomerase [candidate division KSB1 bacterium 4572_119]|nr:MAG: N-(5'-phosphoribosyl)anthranilate isomerase [candidate division KSB1 bacterium 4572_119]